MRSLARALCPQTLSTTTCVSIPALWCLREAVGRTIHENALHHGRFISQKRTFHANAPYRGRFHSPGPNLPRKRPASWKVQCPERNHPRLSPKSWKVPFRRREPSTLRPEIVEGSIPQARTIHDNASYHGWFSIQSGNIRAEARNRGRFHFPSPNPPRLRPESRTVRCKQNQPSTRRLDITDGPCLRAHLPC